MGLGKSDQFFTLVNRHINGLKVTQIASCRTGHCNCRIRFHTSQKDLQPILCHNRIVGYVDIILAPANLRQHWKHRRPHIVFYMNHPGKRNALKIFQRTVIGAVVNKNQFPVQTFKISMLQNAFHTSSGHFQMVVCNNHHCHLIGHGIPTCNIQVFPASRKFLCIILCHTRRCFRNIAPEIKRLI